MFNSTKFLIDANIYFQKHFLILEMFFLKISLFLFNE